MTLRLGKFTPLIQISLLFKSSFQKYSNDLNVISELKNYINNVLTKTTKAFLDRCSDIQVKAWFISPENSTSHLAAYS